MESFLLFFFLHPEISVGRNAGICKIAEDEKELHMSPVGFDIEYRNCKLKIIFPDFGNKSFLSLSFSILFCNVLVMLI